MGPVELDASHTVRDVKQQLEAKVLKEAGERKSFRLLLQDRSAELELNLGDLGTESVDFSAVALQSIVGELTMRSREALSRKEELAKRNTAWLEEIQTATDAKQRQKREEDLRDYQNALQEMIEPTGGSEGTVRVSLGFRRFYLVWCCFPTDPVAAILATRACPPFFRGWYFSTHDDEILDPPEVQMGQDFANSPPEPFGDLWCSTWVRWDWRLKRMSIWSVGSKSSGPLIK